MPKISVIIPIHNMYNGDFFLWRSINALMQQTFKDFEIIITKEGKMAANTNAGIKRARGEIVKILYLDDYLAHPQALQVIADAFTPEDTWLVTACAHQMENEKPHSPHFPRYTQDIHTGNNDIGSPSVLSFRRDKGLLFDEQLSWVLDCDLYRRYFDLFGEPKIVSDINVVIGVGPHQTTYQLDATEKNNEYTYLHAKYA